MLDKWKTFLVVFLLAGWDIESTHAMNKNETEKYDMASIKLPRGKIVKLSSHTGEAPDQNFPLLSTRVKQMVNQPTKKSIV